MEVRTLIYQHGKNKEESYSIICSCGHEEILPNNVTCVRYKYEFGNVKEISPKCSQCNTDILVWLVDAWDRHSISDGYFRLLEKAPNLLDFETLIVPRKTSFNYYDRKYKVRKLERVRYDLINSKLFVEKGKELVEVKNKTDANYYLEKILQQQNLDLIAQQIGNETTMPFLSYVFSKPANAGEKLFTYIHSVPIQILVNAGFGNWTNVLFSKTITNSTGTKPSDILQLPKTILKFIKKFPINNGDLKTIQRLSVKYDGQDLKAGFELILNEYPNIEWNDLKSFLKLVDSEEIPSFQRFCRYVFIEAKHRQGIKDPREVCKLLADSLAMAKEMNVEYKIMPNSLKITHDVLAMNYDVARTDIEQSRFKTVVEDENYLKLNFNGENFKIISPTNGDELIREGQMLSHCVASYFQRVIDKQSKIYFLRELSKPNTPLVTIEVCGNKIHQIAGCSNRKPKEIEKEFINRWAKENNLKYY
jgi:hypothetical protein